MSDIEFVVAAVFISVTCLLIGVGVWIGGRSKVGTRVDQLSQERSSHSLMSSAGSMGGSSRSFRSTVKRSEKESVSLFERITQAGFYKRRTVAIYHVVRICLAVAPIGVGVLAYQLGYTTVEWGIVYGGIASVCGTLLPSFWLDYKKSQRQTQIRRALPDALDVIVICVEAGLSLPAALRKVSKELGTVHPMLATEMGICQREIQLGASSGEALGRLAQRFDLAEMRSLASVVSQAERFGASIVQALRVHAETLRVKRFQVAEEKAQKAAVYLVFPTILCIFPSLFIVLAGPAVFRVFQMFDKMAG